MSKFISFVVCFVAVSLSGAYAHTEAEKAAFREDFKPLVAECSQSHGVTDAQIEAAEQTSSIDGINSCFMGCVLKKSGVLNANGLFDLESGRSILKKYVQSEETIAKYEEVGKKCTSVNDQAVGDTEGCERGKLLITCFLENKAEIPL